MSDRSLSILPALMLPLIGVGLTLGCTGEIIAPADQGPHTISGSLGEGFPYEVAELVAVSDVGTYHVLPVRTDGRFNLDLPSGHSYTLKVRAFGAEDLDEATTVVYPRRDGSVDSAFYVSESDEAFDLGALRFIGGDDKMTVTVTTRTQGLSIGLGNVCAEGMPCVDDNADAACDDAGTDEPSQDDAPADSCPGDSDPGEGTGPGGPAGPGPQLGLGSNKTEGDDAGDCVAPTKRSIDEGSNVSGGVATLVVPEGTCPVEMSFSVYALPDGYIRPFENQVMIENVTDTYGPGTYTLELPLPSCGWQADLYIGPAIPVLIEGVGHPRDAIVDWDFEEGDACDDHDADGDDIADYQDNCADAPNADQADADGDGEGDACEDNDEDGAIDGDDNCPNEPNADQADSDNDGIGDACEDPDNGGSGDDDPEEEPEDGGNDCNGDNGNVSGEVDIEIDNTGGPGGIGIGTGGVGLGLLAVPTNNPPSDLGGCEVTP